MDTPTTKQQKELKEELGDAIKQGNTYRIVDAAENLLKQIGLNVRVESRASPIAMETPAQEEQEKSDGRWHLKQDDENRQRADLLNRFTYHPPKDGQAERYETLRARGLELAMIINELTPPSRERSLAITKLEESIMWANAGIARNE